MRLHRILWVIILVSIIQGCNKTPTSELCAYAKTFSDCLERAEKGDLDAMVAAGEYYSYQSTRDDAEAEKWFEKAGSAGKIEAYYQGGHSREEILFVQYEGFEVKSDNPLYKKMIYFYTKAAEAGHGESLANLTRIYTKATVFNTKPAPHYNNEFIEAWFDKAKTLLNKVPKNNVETVSAEINQLYKEWVSSGLAAQQTLAAMNKPLNSSDNETCQKVSGITQSLTDSLASRADTSVSNIRFIQPMFGSDSGCLIRIDTPNGPQNCNATQIIRSSTGELLADGSCW